MTAGWEIRIRNGGFVLVEASQADAAARAKALRPTIAGAFVDAWRVPSGDAFVRQQLLQLADRLGLSKRILANVSNQQLKREVGRAVRAGRLLALHYQIDPIPGSMPSAQEPGESTEPAPVESPQHTLDFVFEYPDGTAVGGCDYVLIDPTDAKEPGTLPDDGTIHRDDVNEGTYTVELKEVERVLWEKRSMACDAEVKIYASTGGFADGTSARIRVFREFAESDDDVIDTLNAPVQANKVEAPWKYDYASDDARKLEEGAVNFIAEVSFEGGKHWCKTVRRALTVDLKTITAVRWFNHHIHDGDSAELEVETRGYEDGAEVKLEIWARNPVAEDRKVTDLPAATLAAGSARATVTYAQAPEGEDDAADDGAVHRAGEYYVRVKIEDNLVRTAWSDLLWCDAARALTA